MWSRKCGHASDEFVVPKGLNEGSLAIYCQECVQQTTRPVGHGLSWSTRAFTAQGDRTFRPTQSHHTLRDGSFLGHIPGSKLPGYYHSVPPGQKPFVTPIRKIDSAHWRIGRYPTSQQAGIGVRSSSSKTTIKTKARQRIKAHQRPESSFGTILVGSHGNMFVTYRPISIPFVSTCSPLEDPNAASHAAQTADSVRFSSPQTGH